MSDSILHGEAKAEGDTARQLVELLQQIKERLPLPTNDEHGTSPICVRDEKCLHWREIVQSRSSEPGTDINDISMLTLTFFGQTARKGLLRYLRLSLNENGSPLNTNILRHLAYLHSKMK